jgi:hypothetical protein
MGFLKTQIEAAPNKQKKKNKKNRTNLFLVGKNDEWKRCVADQKAGAFYKSGAAFPYFRFVIQKKRVK